MLGRIRNNTKEKVEGIQNNLIKLIDGLSLTLKRFGDLHVDTEDILNEFFDEVVSLDKILVEIDNVYDEGYDEGYDKGYDEGYLVANLRD